MFPNVSACAMFVVVKRRQIWVERRHERARYTVLGEPNEAIARSSATRFAYF